jgi:hypothetical protein
MGRKTIGFDEKQIDEVARLAAYLTRDQLASFFGISAATFDKIRERQPEVEMTYKKARAKIIGKVAQSLVQDALDGDVTSRIFFLKTQGGWREKSDVNLISEDGSMTPKPTLIQFTAPDLGNESDD